MLQHPVARRLFSFLICCIKSHGGPVGITIVYGLDDQGVRVRISVE
jgi:hypothetical protein